MLSHTNRHVLSYETICTPLFSIALGLDPSVLPSSLMHHQILETMRQGISYFNYKICNIRMKQRDFLDKATHLSCEFKDQVQHILFYFQQIVLIFKFSTVCHQSSC